MRTSEVTHTHLNLLRKMWVSWNYEEFGAPCIDPKRPYGNSDVEGDVYEIVEGKKMDSEDSGKLDDKYQRLHSETQIALQICLRYGEFKTGTFERDFCGRWNRKS